MHHRERCNVWLLNVEIKSNECSRCDLVILLYQGHCFFPHQTRRTISNGYARLSVVLAEYKKISNTGSLVRAIVYFPLHMRGVQFSNRYARLSVILAEYKKHEYGIVGSGHCFFSTSDARCTLSNGYARLIVVLAEYKKYEYGLVGSGHCFFLRQMRYEQLATVTHAWALFWQNTKNVIRPVGSGHCLFLTSDARWTISNGYTRLSVVLAEYKKNSITAWVIRVIVFFTPTVCW